MTQVISSTGNHGESAREENPQPTSGKANLSTNSGKNYMPLGHVSSDDRILVEFTDMYQPH
ncbi:hypothetical protein ACJ72_02743 [Emergomyces africanus]|uniref:Uncharacterized protein n=1 Tax=Emergomyces africanus TaxID=1955775 RepID=A0A1B7P1K0_9EURO|nr:hypothetical protein ACJ72_02743 [Emergomyces africanus]